ncbi:MAG: AAA family ATPase [Bacteroidia bacterium]|nr:AAA family ATPase [Bacteroidia bacterium]
MRISKIELSSFKKFVSKRTFSFRDNNEFDGNDVVLIVGNNGVGKSSILQAIVLTTATATREGFDISKFEWPGFDYEHIQTGRFPLEIKCSYEFSDEELIATKDYAKRLIEKGLRLGSPGMNKNVQLKFDYQINKVVAGSGAPGYFQFSGYQYAKRLTRFVEEKNSLFDKVGNIYWYTEQRTSYSISNALDSEIPQLDWVRSFLATAYSFHIAVADGQRNLKNGQFDFYDSLHKLYKSVFPDRTFVGAAPDFDAFEAANAPYFYLSDGVNQYEIAEMSAGERAIFPILLDFARWNINNSIIIIDEVELHLHPSLQQAFVRALLGLGKNNQFILTTHSESVAVMFEENQIIRLS